jgi:hypothetical protein
VTSLPARLIKKYLEDESRARLSFKLRASREVVVCGGRVKREGREFSKVRSEVVRGSIAKLSRGVKVDIVCEVYLARIPVPVKSSLGSKSKKLEVSNLELPFWNGL